MHIKQNSKKKTIVNFAKKKKKKFSDEIELSPNRKIIVNRNRDVFENEKQHWSKENLQEADARNVENVIFEMLTKSTIEGLMKVIECQRAHINI